MCARKTRSTFLAAWSLFWLAAATAAAQPLPTPRHAFDFGYYFVDGKYGPNASLANPNRTIDLQLWTYELAATESVGTLSFVTDGLLMFNYARSNSGGPVCGSGEGGGTRFYPALKATHELMPGIP